MRLWGGERGRTGVEQMHVVEAPGAVPAAEYEHALVVRDRRMSPTAGRADARHLRLIPLLRCHVVVMDVVEVAIVRLAAKNEPTQATELKKERKINI